MPIPTWSLVAALIALALAVPDPTTNRSEQGATSPRVRSRGCCSPRTLDALRFVAIAALAFTARWLIFPRALFHQNGQGALWVQHALEGHPGVASFGAGFPELFAWAARAMPARPELAVTLVQAGLGAIAVAAVWPLARGLGARPLLAGVATAAVALDPPTARAAQSESYFATITSLLLVAAAVLVCGARRPRVRSLPFWGAIVVAGLLVVQAARVHPVGWVPAATLPVLLLVGRGRFTTRLLACACAAFGVAIVVAAATGMELWEVLQGALGRQWMPETRRLELRAPHAHWPWELLLPALVGVAAAPRRWPALIALPLVALLAGATDLIGDPNPSISAAYNRLYLPAIVGVTIALAAAAPARGPAWLARRARAALGARAASAAMALAAAVVIARTHRAAFALPTDVLEAAWVMTWRDRLPPSSRVHLVARVGDRVVAPPIYASVRGVRLLGARPGEPIHWDDAHPQYVLRTSLCSSREGRDACAELDRSARLELVDARTLPAIPSMRWQPYDTPEVRVEIHRARRR